jgi:hypothetical protein
MARRRQTDEIAFGSDSFLDIVANIVGILIILIVIAGVRVAQMPAFVPAMADADPPAEIPPVLAVTTPSSETERHTPETPPTHSPAPRPEPIALHEAIAPPSELLARWAALDDKLARQQQVRMALEANLARKVGDLDELMGQVAASQSSRDSEQDQIESRRRAVATLQTDLEANQRDIAGLHLELAELEAARPPAKPLRHKVTAIEKSLTGQRLCFLLSNDRVAVLPAAELSELAGREILESGAQLLRGRPIVRTVGPINGFRLEFEAKCISLASIESWRSNKARNDRQVLAAGILHESEGIVFELAALALKSNSRFISECRRGRHGAAIIFHVRPDSFEIYQMLRSFAYDNGFDVGTVVLLEDSPMLWFPNGSPVGQ